MSRYEWDEELSSIIERASVDRMPVVVLRADDEHAIDTLWRKRRLHTDAGQHDQARQVDQVINEFAKWRLLHPAQPAATPPRTPAKVGRCGEQFLSLIDSAPAQHCALPADHAGWHRSDSGTEWSPPRTHAEVREQRGPVPGTLPAVLAERIKAEDGA